jgi:cytochrome c5
MLDISARKLGIALLAGFCLLAWVPDGAADDDDDIDPKKNIAAIHDSSSRKYDKDCTECHAAVHSRETLDPNIPSAHVAMFDFAPGKPGDKKQCVWCHRSVDLTQATQSEGKSKGNLRRRVDMAVCGLCHGPSGPGPQFYQAGLSRSPTDPDGPALYDLVCAACHRDLENSQVEGESASEIREAIDENEGGMRPLNVLSSQEIQAIADALAR